MELNELVKKFAEFLEKFYHVELLEKIRVGEKSLTVDFSELIKFEPEIGDLLLDEPEETLKAFELSVESLNDKAKNFTIRFKNLPESTNILIRNIRSKNLGKFLTLEGIVKRKSDVRPHVTSARFECPSCGNTLSILQLDNKFKEPSRCSCGRKGKFRLLSKELVDAQSLVLEEIPEKLEGGEQPKRLDVFLKNDLVSPLSEKKTNPGSRVVITGIVKEVPIITRSGAQSTKFELMFEANCVSSVEEDFTDITINEEEEAKILELSKDPNLFVKLVNSIAPSIYGHDKIKEALLLQLVGGVRKERDDGGITRGDIHILLVGDPGGGKSQLLKRVSKIGPKARYVTGRGASAAGLTATVVRDEFIQGWSLEAGALVLANKGIAAIDELDKMSKEDTWSMHEAMEQQSYHPETKLVLADGSKKKMGAFIDELISKNKKKVQKGNNCEILPVENVKVFSTNFKKVFTVKAKNVSRHVAPNYFIKITYSNNKSIIVTPEHPVFVKNENKIIEIPAESLKEGFSAPVVEETKLKFVKVKKVEKIPNKDCKWVYDICVEPTKNFISEGLILHNSVSISKASIQATLRCETTIIAAANPKFGRFDPYETIVGQINLPPTLINRFDLIFPIKDLPDEKEDEKLASFILELHKDGKSNDVEISTELLRKYIAYAKQNIKPELTQTAINEIKNYFLKLRSGSSKTGVRSVPISARQLEGLVRLSEASAKLRLSKKVMKKDARKAVELLDYCLRQVAFDEESGTFDIDRIATEMPATQRNKLIKVKEIIIELEKQVGKLIRFEDLLKAAKENGLSNDEVEEAVQKLKRAGDVYEPKNGFLSRI